MPVSHHFRLGLGHVDLEHDAVRIHLFHGRVLVQLVQQCLCFVVVEECGGGRARVLAEAVGASFDRHVPLLRPVAVAVSVKWSFVEANRRANYLNNIRTEGSDMYFDMGTL